jgi:hypothetical protein
MHAFMSSCGSKVREYIILNSRTTKPTLVQIEAALSSREYIMHLDSLDKKDSENVVRSTRKPGGRAASKSPSSSRESSGTRVALKDFGCLRCGEEGHWKAYCRQKHKDDTCTSCSKTGHVTKVCLKRLRSPQKASLIAANPPADDEEVPVEAGEMARISPGPNAHFFHYVFQKETQTETPIKLLKPKRPSPGLSRVAAMISTGKPLSKKLEVKILNGSSPNASYVHTQRVSISHTDMFTLKTEFHRVLKTTPGADQQQKYYLYSEVIDLMYR